MPTEKLKKDRANRKYRLNSAEDLLLDNCTWTALRSVSDGMPHDTMLKEDSSQSNFERCYEPRTLSETHNQKMRCKSTACFPTNSTATPSARMKDHIGHIRSHQEN